eukprot:XP_001699360.1 predicted protein [Chlamydomonas reinhardtii]
MFVGLPDKLQTQQPQRRKDDTAWKHPKVTAFVTCFGDLPKQQPRVVRCACGKSPCGLRGLSEGAGVTAEDFIPADWHSKFELPTGAEHVGPESEESGPRLDRAHACRGITPPTRWGRHDLGHTHDALRQLPRARLIAESLRSGPPGA